jgi:imidazolonepropionase-like amidohydrolase
VARLLFTNVKVFDGSDGPALPGEVLVEDNLITRVEHTVGAIEAPDAERIDGKGAFLMPGLVEAHSHLSYGNVTTLEQQGDIPPEENVLNTIKAAELMLMSGFTSLYSAASARMRTDVVVRNAIDSGQFPGPRIRAASPEITCTGGLGDARLYHQDRTTFSLIADGELEMRKIIRTAWREGVDVIKLNLSGDGFVRPGNGEQTAYTEQEVAAAAQEAQLRGLWMAAHARSDSSVKLALKYGFRNIYHCDYIEGETFDLLEEKKDSIFLAPAIGMIYASVHEGSPWGLTPEVNEVIGYKKMLDTCPGVYAELQKRGLRIMPGGDYGFAWNPIGNNARDLEHFVELLGFSPTYTLMSATKWGGECMGIDNLGMIKEGWLADVLLVDGDPLDDIRILQDRDNIVMVLKDGVIHKRDLRYFDPAAADRGATVETAERIA